VGVNQGGPVNTACSRCKKKGVFRGAPAAIRKGRGHWAAKNRWDAGKGGGFAWALGETVTPMRQSDSLGKMGGLGAGRKKDSFQRAGVLRKARRYGGSRGGWRGVCVRRAASQKDLLLRGGRQTPVGGDVCKKKTVPRRRASTDRDSGAENR